MAAPQQAGILLSGIVPPLADAFYSRTESGPGIAAAVLPGETVVLTHAGDATSVQAAQGGCGKTQIAAEFIHSMWNGALAEALIWVTASSRESIVTGFAQAASIVDSGHPAEAAESAAARFAAWLAHTRRQWALVVDDLRDLADLADLWPSGASGRVVITTTLDAAEFAGAPGFGNGTARVVAVGGFSRREALSYLGSRLTEHPDQRIEALDLAQDMDRLPLGLSLATAVMSVRELGCREYRGMLAERRRHMNDMDNVSSVVLAAWSLAAECAHRMQPEGLAWPTLALAAMLDRNGIPGAVLTSPAACGYIAGRPSTGGRQDQSMVRATIRNLAQAGLVTVDPGSAVRTVRMHATVQAAVRAWLPRADLEQVSLAAADALLESWPDSDSQQAPHLGQAQLEQALRDCAAALRGADSALLWKPEAHPLLFRVGLSLDGSRLNQPAIAHWQSMAATGTRLLGPAHVNSVVARDRLAVAYEVAGMSGEAIAVFQAALADRERNQGPDHPETIAARGHLAHAYQSAGRPADAVALYERTVADYERLLGPAHPTTFAARASLGDCYQAAGKLRDAIYLYHHLVSDAGQLMGTGHPITLSARASLGAACQAAGRHKDAIDAFEQALTEQERINGQDHPDTIGARATLASAYRAGGRHKEAIGQCERVLADRERVGGGDHRDTLTARGDLAFAYRSAGRLREAISGYERTLADRERVQSGEHRDTLIARSNLAATYQQARRLADAITQYERAVTDCERMLGGGDKETLTTRCNLASAYYTAGRLNDVVTVLQRTLTDCERYLGVDHPMTATVRENLNAATHM